MNFRSRPLLNLAHKLHTCTNCGRYVTEGLEPAHADSQRYGKGGSLKAHDHFHAAMCHQCHEALPNMDREERMHTWQRAFESTLTEYWQRGWLKVVSPKGE